MNTLQIKAVLEKEGIPATVCAVNQLPSKIDVFPASFIVNTDEHHEPGEHWVAIHFTSDRKGEFFDSYGHLPSFFDSRFRKFLLRNATDISYNTKGLQGPLSVVCGHYCLFYIMHRVRGIDSELLLKMLDQYDTDVMVQSCLNQHLMY